MNARIAVATVSGKAYYFLVNELKRKNVPFLSVMPSDSIPLYIKTVITTKKEHPEIKHQNVLVYNEDEDASEIIDQAIRISRGKTVYERLVVGVDPGQTFGVVVLEDRNILEAKNCTSLDGAVIEIQNLLEQMPSRHTIVKIGNGSPSLAENLWHLLDETLPKNVVFESVREEGTSQLKGEAPNRRGKRDVNSALVIAQRNGQVLSRSRQE
jgi:hypothetical protein